MAQEEAAEAATSSIHKLHQCSQDRIAANAAMAAVLKPDRVLARRHRLFCSSTPPFARLQPNYCISIRSYCHNQGSATKDDLFFFCKILPNYYLNIYMGIAVFLLVVDMLGHY